MPKKVTLVAPAGIPARKAADRPDGGRDNAADQMAAGQFGFDLVAEGIRPALGAGLGRVIHMPGITHHFVSGSPGTTQWDMLRARGSGRCPACRRR